MRSACRRPRFARSAPGVLHRRPAVEPTSPVSTAGARTLALAAGVCKAAFVRSCCGYTHDSRRRGHSSAVHKQQPAAAMQYRNFAASHASAFDAVAVARSARCGPAWLGMLLRRQQLWHENDIMHARESGSCLCGQAHPVGVPFRGRPGPPGRDPPPVAGAAGGRGGATTSGAGLGGRRGGGRQRQPRRRGPRQPPQVRSSYDLESTLTLTLTTTAFSLRGVEPTFDCVGRISCRPAQTRNVLAWRHLSDLN